MNKLRIHVIIVIFCFFSFLLAAGWIIVIKGRTSFDRYEKPMVRAKDNHKNGLMKTGEFKNTGSPKSEILAAKNGRLR